MDATSSLYRGHRFPVEIISHCVWLYHRFPLSLRDVEEMMVQRGVSVTYDTIHQWCRTFGQIYAGYRGFWTGIRRQSLFLLVEGLLSDCNMTGASVRPRNPTRP